MEAAQNGMFQFFVVWALKFRQVFTSSPTDFKDVFAMASSILFKCDGIFNAVHVIIMRFIKWEERIPGLVKCVHAVAYFKKNLCDLACIMEKRQACWM